jgi:excisionase family DNA binding protein
MHMGLLTTSEAAERLGVTRWRVSALIQAGRLKAEKKGQIYLIDERDLKPVMVRKVGRPPKPKAETGKVSKKKGSNK